MRTLCDACENSAAVVFCAADEAALCSACDDKVHSCNKLASRHVRVGLAIPSDVPRCDICENAPAFFYCEIDGTSLCLPCDTNVHVGGKRMHSRYLLLRQRVEFPGDKSGRDETLALQAADQGETRRGQNQFSRSRMRDPARTSEADSDGHVKMDTNIIDLNIKPFRVHEHASDNHQDQCRLF